MKPRPPLHFPRHKGPTPTKKPVETTCKTTPPLYDLPHHSTPTWKIFLPKLKTRVKPKPKSHPSKTFPQTRTPVEKWKVEKIFTRNARPCVHPFTALHQPALDPHTQRRLFARHRTLTNPHPHSRRFYEAQPHKEAVPKRSPRCRAARYPLCRIFRARSPVLDREWGSGGVVCECSLFELSRLGPPPVSFFLVTTFFGQAKKE